MADDGDDEWRFSIDEVGPDDEDDHSEEDRGNAWGETADEENEGGEDGGWGTTIGEDDDGPTVTVGGPRRAADEVSDALDDEDGGNVAGSLTPEVPVESGTPEFENVVFVTAGVLLAVLVFVSLVVSDPLVLGGVALAVLLASAGMYAFFSRF